MSVEGNSSMDNENFFETAKFVNGEILMPIFCVIGLIGNAITLVVLQQKTMKTSTNVYLCALAVSDTVKLLNDGVYFAVLMLHRTNFAAANRAFGHYYPYAHFLFNMSACISSWLTVSVAVERYILVCHAVRAKTICTRERATITSAIIFFGLTILSIPSVLRYKTVIIHNDTTNQTLYEVELTNLWKNVTFTTAYTWVQTLLRSVIPLLILVVMNACIIKSLRKTRANKKLTSRNRVTVMLIVVILVFLVCITPDAIMSSFLGFGYHEANKLVKGIREFTDVLLAFNAATNFIVYCAFNVVFRQHFMVLFCGSCYSGKVHSETQESQYRRLSESQSDKSHRNGCRKAVTQL